MTETKNLKLKTYETATDGQELVARYIDNTSDNFQKIDEFCKTDTTLSVEGGIADAKTVGDNVSQLKGDLSNIVYTEKSYGIVINDGLLDISNGTVIPYNAKYVKLPIKPFSKVTLSFNKIEAGSGTRGITFYDYNENFLFAWQSIPYISDKLTYEFEVPSNAFYIAFTTFDGKFLMSCTEKSNVIFKDVTPNLYEDKYIDKNGNIYNGGGSYRLYSSEVNENEIVYLHSNFTHSSVGYGLFNNGIYVSGGSYTINQSGSPYEIIIPTGVNEIKFSGYGTRKAYLTRVKTFDTLSHSSSKPFDKINQIPSFVTMFRRITCIGDSLTRGEFDTTTIVEYRGNNRPGFSWVAQMQKMTGVECVNLGIGSHSASRSAPNPWIVTALDTERGQSYPFPVTDFTEKKGDAYIIALGTNDIGSLGSFTGDVSTDIKDDYTQNASTSVGGYAEIIQRVLEMQPKAKIFCVTIPKTRNTAEQRNVANAKIKAIANRFGAYIIDLEEYGEETTGIFSKYYKNASHTNALGHNLRARQYISYIDWIVENNLDDFRNVQFIGEETTWEPN